MNKTFLLTLLSLLLVSCATAYQPNGLSGGYSETQLSENTFQVHFRGNGYTARERASDFALLRSAEITLQHGFEYFIIVNNQSDTSLSTYTTPTTSYTTGYANTTGTLNTYGNYGTYSGNTYGSATTTTYGGQTYLISKPSTTDIIVCFKEKPNIKALVFDAKFIKKSLMAKYGLDKKDSETKKAEEQSTEK